jgi:hypothetical protein
MATPAGLKSSSLGQLTSMSKLLRTAIVAAISAPIAALSVVTAASGSAQPQPINCPPGQYWDPGSNSCKNAVALNCPPGQYWNPITNFCRPLGQY